MLKTLARLLIAFAITMRVSMPISQAQARPNQHSLATAKVTHADGPLEIFLGIDSSDPCSALQCAGLQVNKILPMLTTGAHRAMPIVAVVPELNTYVLMATGLVGIFGVVVRRRMNTNVV